MGRLSCRFNSILSRREAEGRREAGESLMVRFDAYDGLARALQRVFIGQVHFIDGFPWRRYFETEKRALIIASHGPIIGPLVWVMALFPRIADLGFGHLTYSAIAHPIIRNIPIFARMVGFEKRGGSG